VTELASNVIRHALLRKEEEAFRLVLHVMEEQVLVRVYHRGLACPEEFLVNPVLESPAEGGMGLYLLASVTNGLRQGSDDPGVTWIEFFKAFVASAGELAD
jgi:anti-sigma regulatory factor (Ser/Thr protein kinase)